MNRKVILIIGGVTAIALIAGPWLLYSYIRGVTAEEVDANFKKHIPIGSSFAEVSAFIDSLKTGSHQIDNFGYRGDLTPQGLGLFGEKDKQLAGRAKGYMQVMIHHTSRTYYLSEVDMHVRFYFDSNDRLIDYQILEMFD